MSAADALALGRAVASIPIAWAIVIDARPIALVLFALAAASDALDGPLARRTGAPTPHGALLDPLADKVLVVGTLVALATAGAGWPVTMLAVLVGAREGVVAFARTRAFRRGVVVGTDRLAKAKTAAEMTGLALVIVGGCPWSVAGTAMVGGALVLGIVTLPRYLARRPAPPA